MTNIEVFLAAKEVEESLKAGTYYITTKQGRSSSIGAKILYFVFRQLTKDFR